MDKKHVLDNLEQLAGTPSTEEEIAHSSGFANKKAFHTYLKKHKAYDTWRTTRDKFWADYQKSVLALAKKGNPRAQEFMTEVYKAEKGLSGLTLTKKEMKNLVGMSYQTLNTWENKHGLKYDKKSRTYLLRDVIHFLIKYYEQVGRDSAPKAIAAPDEFRQEKLRKIRLENKASVGSLLPRDEVIAGMAARRLRLSQGFHQLGDLATELEGKPYHQILAILEKHHTEVLRTQKEDLPELKLNPELEASFRELLDAIEQEEKST